MSEITTTQYVFLTSFSPTGYKTYGRKFLDSYVKYGPKNTVMVVLYENEQPQGYSNDPRFVFINLHSDEQLLKFIEQHRMNPTANGLVEQNGQLIVDFRWQATRFVNKVCALTTPKLPIVPKWLIWIDSDVEFTSKMPETFLPELLENKGGDVFYLGRPKEIFNTSECGFVAYNYENPKVRQFLDDFRNCYIRNEVFALSEWHDSYVFDYLRRKYENELSFVNIAEGIASMHPWEQTVLQQYLNHQKGPTTKMDAVAEWSPILPKQKDMMSLLEGCSTRYEQIIRILQNYPHQTILEVGTHNGNRGIEMCSVNLAKGFPVKYFGFDLFEHGNEQTNIEELNAKGNPRFEDVNKKFAELQSQFPTLFTYKLVAGNTRETLANPDNLPDKIDFVWLDGGHSIETIYSDFENLKNRADLIILDDYYHSGVDTEKFGCNKLTKNIRHILLPKIDNFGNNLSISLVAAGKNIERFKNMSGVPAEFKTRPPTNSNGMEGQDIQLKTQNCVENSVIHDNIRYASTFTKKGLKTEIEKITKENIDDLDVLTSKLNALKNRKFIDFVSSGYNPITHSRIVFVGGSTSIKDSNHPEYNKNWKRIKSEVRKGALLVAVKTSYDECIEHKLIPWGCILLDPRDHVASKITKPHKNTNYFIASMCDKSTWDKFAQSNEYKVIGYHAGVGADETPIIQTYFDGSNAVISGGTTSGFRGLSLMIQIGYRHFTMIGFDSSYHEKPTVVHGRSVKEAIQVSVHGKTFWTDPELIAQSKDMEMILKVYPYLDIEFVGNGMLQHASNVVREMQKIHAGEKNSVETPLAVFLNAWKVNDESVELLMLDHVIPAMTKRKLFLQKKFLQNNFKLESKS